MADLKHYWLKTAKSFVLAADDLIVAVAQTAKAGRDMVIEWAENAEYQAQGTEIPTEDVAEAPVEESVEEAKADQAPAEAPVEEAPAEAPAEEAPAEPEVKAEAQAAPEAPADKKSKKSKK